jgi:hypothetical protein
MAVTVITKRRHGGDHHGQRHGDQQAISTG